MKKTVLLGLLISIPAFSATVKLPADAVGLSNVAEIKLTQVIMPKPEHIAPGLISEVVSIGVFTATLDGCVDELGPVATHLKSLRSGKLAVYVSAVNIKTERSRSARCFVKPTATFSVTLGMGFIDDKNVEVIVLN